MRKRMCLWLALIMLLTVCFVPTVYAEKEEDLKAPELGDVNGVDGVTAADAAEILRSVVRLVVLSDTQKIYADCNGDGEITAADASAILRFVVRLDSLPPSVTFVPPPSGSPSPTPNPTNPTGLDGVTAEGKIDADELYLRNGPGTDYEVVTLMLRDTNVYVFEKSGDWYHVQIMGSSVKGWAFAKYVELTNNRLAAYGKLVVASDVYEEARVTSLVLINLPVDTTVGIVGQKDDFYLVRLLDSGLEGFVLKTYIPTTTSVDAGPSPSPSPSTTPVPDGTTGVTGEGIINADKVNLRSDAGTEFDPPITKLAKGTSVYVFEKKKSADQTDWFRVQIKGSSTAGWVRTDFVDIPAGRISYYAYINANEVKFRSGAGTTYATLPDSPLAHNTQLGIIGRNANETWYKVRILKTGTDGWVFAQYVTLTTPVT